ncbi:hypothetical protein LPJ57_008406, partial [Coemansia sp. RSA 486]
MNRNPHNYERIYSGGEMDPHSRQSPAPTSHFSGARRIERMHAGDVRQMKVITCPDKTLAHTNLLA